MKKFGNRAAVTLTLAGAALYPLGYAYAGDATSQDRLEQLEEQIKILQDQVLDLKAGTAGKFAETKRSLDDLPAISLKDGRPAFKTADGNFTASLRVLAQLDSAYYIQDNAVGAIGQDLSSGTNFRRARFGIEGTLFRSWDYAFTGEYGGSGAEGNASLQQAWLQYGGLKPVFIRAGAFRPSVGLEDSTSSGDTLFLERSSVSEITSQIAGADGREGVSVTYAPGTADVPGRVFAQAAYTGDKVNSGSVTAFDEQQGATGRLAGLLYSGPATNILLGVNGSYAWDLPDAAAGPGSASNVRFRDRPELRVDGTYLIDTGNINARSAYHYGVDGGFNYKNLYAEAGYFRFGADQRATSTDPAFSGYYLQGSWVITGEPHRYDSRTASWRAPKVTNPLTGGADSGWGAWEIAARYSKVDLNDNDGAAGSATPAGGVRGGEQSVYSGAVNWYANAAVRLALQYQYVSVDRLSAAGAQVGQDYQAVAARVQFGF